MVKSISDEDSKRCFGKRSLVLVVDAVTPTKFAVHLLRFYQ